MKEPTEVEKHGRKRWLVDLREFDAGRRFFKTLTAARRYQSSVLEEQAVHGALAFDLPHETRRRYLAAETRLSELGATIEQAVDWFAKTHRPEVQRTLGDAVKDCLQAKREAGCRPRYLEQFGYSLASLVASIGSGVQCADVTHQQIEAWLANPKWGPRHRKGKLIDVRTLFSFARKRNWCQDDPCAPIDPVILDEKPPGILTPGQAAAILEACVAKRPKLLPFVILGLFCGIRPEEIRKLTWADIDLASCYVKISAKAAKGRKRRLVKLQLNALAWLKSVDQQTAPLPVVNQRRDWVTVRKAAGFLSERPHWPHDALRHSFCSYALPIHGAAQTSQWAGNSETILFQCYRELVTKEDAERFWAIAPAP